jgi:hypothetical protein
MIQMYRKSVPGPLLPELDELIVGIRVVIFIPPALVSTYI